MNSAYRQRRTPNRRCAVRVGGPTLERKQTRRIGMVRDRAKLFRRDRPGRAITGLEAAVRLE